ncbi:MAG: DUF4494 domain-containing protein [Prevotella sp.]|nr:DUF4494 domain-containing protein [Prevotella sp.]
MKSKTANWFECTVRPERQIENGLTKAVPELYVVEAVSFGDAEKTITEEISAYVSGSFEVKNINPAAYREIFFSEDDNDDRWYKAKLSFITIDEKSEKEKRSTVTYLVQAATFSGAVKNVQEVMSGTMIDYDIANITETKIMDVFTKE